MIEAIAVDHFEAPAVAYRISYKGKSIVYTGDTHSTTSNLVTLAQGVDMLIYDASILDNAPPPQSPFAKRQTPNAKRQTPNCTDTTWPGGCHGESTYPGSVAPDATI